MEGLARRADRRPDWPAGILGSITHCDGYAAAAVAWRGTVGALGIDAEPNRALPMSVLDLVVTPRERNELDRRGRDSICWDRMLFSIKESVYKAWSPLTNRWLDFQDVEVEIQADMTFVAHVRDAGGHTAIARGSMVNSAELLGSVCAELEIPDREHDHA